MLWSVSCWHTNPLFLIFVSSSNASLCSKIANLFHLTCPVFVATETLQSGVLLHFEQVCMLERVLCSHLEQFPAPKTWTEIAPRYFETILFPFHHLCRRRMVKCSSQVEPGLFLAVIYIYPVLYTSSSCSPLCHQGKCFFFFLPLLCRWGEWGWQGQPQAVEGPGSWTWLLLEHMGSAKHQQVIQLASVPLQWQRWDPSIRLHASSETLSKPSPPWCILIMQDFRKVMDYAFR